MSASKDPDHGNVEGCCSILLFVLAVLLTASLMLRIGRLESNAGLDHSLFPQYPADVRK